jgi:serine/threonine protein kinase
MHVRQEGNPQLLDLEIQPLGRGGEAAIFAVIGEPELVAKIYHRPRAEYADKLAAMLAKPPKDPMAKAGHASIAWPIGRLYAPSDESRFVGYLMPRIDKARLIYEYYNPRSRQQICPLFHYGYLLRTARNLAAAVRALHERGYVVGDLNESNILVTSQALVSLVDTDSFQVPGESGIFRCRVGKPEYTPPELQGARFADVDRGPEHDSFGLAVLIFQLLMQGTHPYAGIFTKPGEADAIPRRIRNGYWPYAETREVPVEPSPHAPSFDVLPLPVQELMHRTFDEGHRDPLARPHALEWQRALTESEKVLTTCAQNTQHVYVDWLASCPWCAMASTQGRDPFPSAEQLKSAKRSSKMTLSPTAKSDLGQEAKPEPGTPVPETVVQVEPPKGSGLLNRYRRNVGKAYRDAVLFLVLAGIVAGGLWYAMSGDRSGAQPVTHVETPEGPAEAANPINPPAPAPVETPFQLVLVEKEIIIGRDARLRIPVRIERRNFPGPIRLEVKTAPASIQSDPVIVPENATDGVLDLLCTGGTEAINGAEIVLQASSVENEQFTRMHTVRVSVPGKPAIPEPKPPTLNPKGLPEVLGPDEFEIQTIHGAVRTLIYAQKNNKLHVLFLQPVEKVGPAPRPNLPIIIFPRPGMRFPPPGVRPPPPPAGPVPGPFDPVNRPDATMTTRWVEVSEMEKSIPEDSHPAHAHTPAHLVVVHAAFPFRRQVQAIQEALGLESLAALEREVGIEFLGLAVQRRVIRADGLPAHAWADIDVIRDLRPLLAFGVVPEDPRLLKAGVTWKKDKLLLPRPALLRDVSYPPLGLASIDAAVVEAEKDVGNGELPILRPRNRADKDYDFLDRDDEKEKPEEKSLATSRFLPEKCLLRFVDASVQPGQTYEYRVRVRLTNPLYERKDVPAELTRSAELPSNWVSVPGRTHVAERSEFYFVEEDPRKARAFAANPDRVWVQVQRWIDSTPLNPVARKDPPLVVADWVIGDHLPAVRGQYIGEWAYTEVAVWSPLREQFVLAHTEATRKGGRTIPGRNGIPIDFTTDNLLVDFQGGLPEYAQKEKEKVRDVAGVEALIMTPDGKLRVRRRTNDAEAERRNRYEAYDKLLREAKSKLEKRDVFRDFFKEEANK